MGRSWKILNRHILKIDHFFHGYSSKINLKPQGRAGVHPCCPSLDNHVCMLLAQCKDRKFYRSSLPYEETKGKIGRIFNFDHTSL